MCFVWQLRKEGRRKRQENEIVPPKRPHVHTHIVEYTQPVFCQYLLALVPKALVGSVILADN